MLSSLILSAILSTAPIQVVDNTTLPFTDLTGTSRIRIQPEVTGTSRIRIQPEVTGTSRIRIQPEVT
ncbi:MAG: hypothetical protein P8M49_12140, partial [Thalassotalea sp.]|nr:hypothetical protein [Thalassotalea sp.]